MISGQFNLLWLKDKLIFSSLLLFVLLICTSSASAQTLFDKDRNKKEDENKPPIVKNLRFENGCLYLDAAGSYIDLERAILKVNNREAFPLNMDDSGVFLRVGRERTSSPGGISISAAIPQGQEVTIVVQNPNGNSSSPVSFRR